MTKPAIYTILVLLLLSCTMDGLRLNDDFFVYYSDDYSELLQDSKFSQKAEIEGIQFVDKKINSGFAGIEMLAQWQNKPITEDSVSTWRNTDDEYNRNDFLEAMAYFFPEWKVVLYSNITNTELLKKIHASLENGFPVPVKFGNATSLSGIDLSIVTMMDLAGDEITVQDYSGGEKTYTVKDFINDTQHKNINDDRESFDRNKIYIITEK